MKHLLPLLIGLVVLLAGCKDDKPTISCLSSASWDQWTHQVLYDVPDVYTKVFYSENSIDFYVKYHLNMDTSFMDMGNRIQIGAVPLGSGGWDNAANGNFSGTILVGSNHKVKVDLSKLSMTNKRVEFDVNFDRSFWLRTANPFEINGVSVNALPSGVSMSIQQLPTGCHVILTGPINDLQWSGWETAYDNLCVNKA